MHNQLGFRIAACLLVLSFLGHLLSCPHSKVEESFQLQATHDLFYHGIKPALRLSLVGGEEVDGSSLPYDHLQYPGGKYTQMLDDTDCYVSSSKAHDPSSKLNLSFFAVVPRTFTGPIVLATLCHILRLFLLPVGDIAAHPMIVQFVSRLFLSLIIAHGWVRLASTVDQTFRGFPFLGTWLLLITSCQFHMTFYASRMLPNVFALAVVLHSYAYWMQGNIKLAAAGVVLGTAVFRCDLLLLLFSLGVSWLLLRQLSVMQALKTGVVTGILSLMITVPLDSVLWQRLLWPEGEVFYFNTVLGKSSDWGTLPWHWYFTSALPKSMLMVILLVPLSSFRLPELLVAWERRWRSGDKSDASVVSIGSLLDVQWLRYTIPLLGYVILYSFLGHKEMRFIFPAIPILNLAAAVGMARLSRLAFPPLSKGKEISWIARVAFVCGVLCMLLTLTGNLIFGAVSRWNYPGGDALLLLSKYVQQKSLVHDGVLPPLHVHVDVASAMSGVSLFGQKAAQADTPALEWLFDKSGYEDENALGGNGYSQFTHLLSESRDVSVDFFVIGTIQGLPRLNFRGATISTEDYIYILERKGWSDGNWP